MINVLQPVSTAAHAVGGYTQLAGVVAISLATLAGLGWLAVRVARNLTSSVTRRARKLRGDTPTATMLLYLVYVAAILLSATNSWRVASAVLQYPWPIRVGVLVLIEGFLVAIAVGMHREAVTENGDPFKFRPYLYGLLTFITGGAIAVLGTVDGLFQGGLILLGVAALHLALGIELRAAEKTATGALSRVLREFQERILSRIGLGDDSRDALTRTRDRAARRVARLGMREKGFFLQRRYDRALRISGIDSDPRNMDQVLDTLAVLQHRQSLRTIVLPSPFHYSTERQALAQQAEPAALEHAPVETERPAAPIEPSAAPAVAAIEQTAIMPAVDPTADPAAPEQNAPETVKVFEQNDLETPGKIEMTEDQISVAKRELSICPSDAARIRYALGRVDLWWHRYDQAPTPADVAACLASLDHPVSTENVRTVMRRNGAVIQADRAKVVQLRSNTRG